MNERVVKLSDVLEFIDGIERDDDDSGWWPNSAGAMFGREIVSNIKSKSFLIVRSECETNIPDRESFFLKCWHWH